DNDGDGQTDCADSDCASNAACQTAVCDGTTLYWDYSGPVTCTTGFQCGLDSASNPPVPNCLPNVHFASGINYGPCGTSSACPFGDYCVAGTCYPLCDPDTNPACPNGDCLYTLTVGGTPTEWELCKQADSCNAAADSGCTAPKHCILAGDYAHCLTTDASSMLVPVGSACQYIDDCVAGAFCAGTCYEVCRLGVQADCSSGTCTDFGNTLYGACL
ncbi:hypothetical protein KJ612_07095, partial [Myxococcota bacterium]|nr:hypothetical protein [Myxococcota bacterium]